jgi:hypothetical protein
MSGRKCEHGGQRKKRMATCYAPRSTKDHALS